ncbi:hypothetical protein M6B38_244750 [Iris pallida]|uniref:Uncharacterized protein n=1 Tax=Iris pallida TaxID=29817 RepID=A0AAX6DI15_IRIPA|nr:hypothetical protein M6B38_244750 [Iris pallida]
MLPSPVQRHFDDEICGDSSIDAPLFSRPRSLSSATAKALMTTEISFSSGGSYFPDRLNRSPPPQRRNLWLAVSSDDGGTRSLPAADQSRFPCGCVEFGDCVLHRQPRAERTRGAVLRQHLAVHDDEDLFVLSVSDTTRTVSDIDFSITFINWTRIYYPACISCPQCARVSCAWRRMKK